MRTTFDNATRARVAAGWDASRLTQAEYARLHSIRPRTLRLWRAQRVGMREPLQAIDLAARAAVAGVDALRARLVALDAALDAARTAVAACRASLDAVAACRSMPGPSGFDLLVGEPQVEVADDAGGMPGQVPGEVEDSPFSQKSDEDRVANDEGAAPQRTLLDVLVTKVQGAQPAAATSLGTEEATAPRAPPGRLRGAFFSEFT